jgi:hypothetical protein
MAMLKKYQSTRVDTIKNSPKVFLLQVVVAILSFAGLATAADTPGQGEAILLEAYHRNMTRMETSNFGVPLHLESFEQDDSLHVDVYGIFAYPFDTVADVLDGPSNWCDIVSLHPNIKACTYRGLAEQRLLTLYLGLKDNQALEDTRQITCRYRSVERQHGYLNVILVADQGPYGTKNHSMRFEALPLAGGKTFVHVTYAFSDSAMLRLAAKIYFATLGRGKIGFTVTGIDRNGAPIYIGGPRGALERSAARYYFAIQSFMNALPYPEEIRFNMRIIGWYDLTIPHKRQLFDLDRREYLLFKTSEHRHQVNLQRQIGAGGQ